MESILFLKEVSSTNSFIKDLANSKKLAEGFVVSTDYQTAGRGQKGNSWESEVGKNISFSIIFYPRFIEASEQFILSQLVSLAIKDVLDTYTKNISIKWPNDIYWNDKKICGILIENDLMESTIYRSIIGIGLNINQTEFISDAPNPISLRQILGYEVDREHILQKIQSTLISYYNTLKHASINQFANRYKSCLYRSSGYYTYKDNAGNFIAIIKGIDESGRLVLETDKGDLRSYNFKEVTYI